MAEGRVGIINTDKSRMEVLDEVLTEAGYTLVGTGCLDDVHLGKTTIEEFIKVKKADLLIIDIVPPYEANWEIVADGLDSPCAAETPVVVMTTNPDRVLKVARDNHHVIQLLGKPFDLDTLLFAVNRAMQHRGPRPHC